MDIGKMTLVGGGKSDTIHLPVTPGSAEEVPGDMTMALQQVQYTYHGRNIWVQAQRAPWIQKRHSAFGRARAFLPRVVEQSEVAEPIRFACTWQRDFVITAIEDEFEDDPSEAGYVDEHGECHFNDHWTKE
eukprot:2787973-Pyramimonas_sp.AAC.1